MRCPSCGADLDGQVICARCGKRFESPSKKIEVEYKDFKVSELLEIRSKDQGTHGEEPGIEKTGAQDVDGRKSSPFLIALILFLLALIASGVLLWKLFTR